MQLTIWAIILKMCPIGTRLDYSTAGIAIWLLCGAKAVLLTTWTFGQKTVPWPLETDFVTM